MRHTTVPVIVTLTLLAALPTAANAQSPFGRHFGLPSPLGILKGIIRGPRAFRPRTHRATRPHTMATGTATRAEARAEPNTTGERAAAQPTFNIYEEMLGYAVTPAPYASSFWSRGYNDLTQSFLKQPGADNDGSGSCGAKAMEQAAKPLDRISNAVALTEPQRSALQSLRIAAMKAAERGESVCRDAVPTAPPERLKVLMDVLWAMRDANLLLRTPLDSFYKTLTAEQTSQLNAPSTVGGRAASVCDSADNDMPSIGPAPARAAPPTKEQREGLETLQRLTVDLSKYVATSCPQDQPDTAVGRLDAAGNRIDAMLYALTNLEPAISGMQPPSGNDTPK